MVSTQLFSILSLPFYDHMFYINWEDYETTISKEKKKKKKKEIAAPGRCVSVK